MTDAIIIGAGVIGTSVAYRLSQAGIQVTVLEAERVGGGTSGASFAWTNANNKVPRPYFDLNVAGMRAHAALADEFAQIPWRHGGGRLEWTDESGRAIQREKVERLRSWDYAAEWLTGKDVHEIEPDIDLEMIGDAPVAYYPEEGWLDPVVYAQAIMTAARRLGARLEIGVRVNGVALRSGRVTGVRSADGRVFHADWVINCAGCWLNEAADHDALQVPLAPTTGFLVLTPPVPTQISRVVCTPVCDFRPDGAGRLMIHWGPADATITPDLAVNPGMTAAEELVQRLARVLPCIGTVEPEAVRAATRPIPKDSYSAVGRVPGVDGYYVVVTHSGVTLAPFLGIAVADEVAYGRTRPELAPFRPGRFFETHGAVGQAALPA
ncbi:FAD-binding oxidoreductase [Microvirga aerilata]|uniref:FAD-binding oxidoreductase n=1 Tax=Microvirga aerilata TaxID=670292 RepID=A0A936ZDI2_9HYPH|nr:FAD-binding oxidoreductase [Microvirga aerilata]MBL0403745.1 FAD-binding oxidoreductase [Microvirga aerilata]